uniref:Alcohol dehydrogenase, class IV n=1 Tax=Candidatus Kentrum sp. LFY TaxID=2126342 RepID=A0A450UW12_9GAMM|nr:MAG: Alcohol dehydrogenase, class IV [Candidatus Kentron sp. LFY]
MHDFDYGRVPPIYFGSEKLSRLPTITSQLGGKRILLVTGGASLQASGKRQYIETLLRNAGIAVHSVACPGEPSTSFIDDTCARFRSRSIDVVVGIGGGSVVDAGKAISAMLPHENSIFDHIEGVGRGIPYNGVKKPYIAVPTTSGTGSETTKNAVISEVGPTGYKKSLRHDNLIPDAVIIDGELLISCPPEITFACGMDAFTQLLEPYLSPRVSGLTEAMAWSGFEAIAENFPHVCDAASHDTKARQGMAYGALLSGVALANDGVGIVHGLASPIGGRFPIPHGAVCATLTAPSVRANLEALRARAPQSPALDKMARVGALLSAHGHGQGAHPLPDREISLPSNSLEIGNSARDRDKHCDGLLDILDEWTRDFHAPRLGQYGIREQDLDAIAEKAQNRNNPIELTQGEIREMLQERL